MLLVPIRYYRPLLNFPVVPFWSGALPAITCSQLPVLPQTQVTHIIRYLLGYSITFVLFVWRLSAPAVLPLLQSQLVSHAIA